MNNSRWKIIRETVKNWRDPPKINQRVKSESRTAKETFLTLVRMIETKV